MTLIVIAKASARAPVLQNRRHRIPDEKSRAVAIVTLREQRVVFVLWGSYARRKADLVDNPQHVVIEAGHPSPMNPRGFLGTRPFSAIDKALAEVGAPPIRWA